MISPSAELDSATSHRPGSPEKLRLLRARAAANLPLHIPGDAYLEHSPADLHQMLDTLSAAERDVRDLKALMGQPERHPREACTMSSDLQRRDCAKPAAKSFSAGRIVLAVSGRRIRRSD